MLTGATFEETIVRGRARYSRGESCDDLAPCPSLLVLAIVFSKILIVFSKNFRLVTSIIETFKNVDLVPAKEEEAGKEGAGTHNPFLEEEEEVELKDEKIIE